MFTRPVLQPVKPFDATKDFTFTFSVQSGPQVQAHEFIVINNANNAIVYQSTQNSLVLRHLLPSNTLINGGEYRARVRVRDLQNNWSSYSEDIIFYTLAPPIITFTNIDSLDRVYNQTEIFRATYYHPQNEPLQSYRFILYNQNKSLLHSFPEQFGTGMQPLVQEVAGLINGNTYYIEIRTLSQKGQEGSSGLVMFVPFYITPRLFTTLTAEPDFKQGAIKLSANILQIIMKLYDPQNVEIPAETIVYTDDEKLDMNRPNYAKLVAAEGFNINQPDFVLQIWGSDFIIDEPLLILFSDFGQLIVTIKEEYVQVEKILYNSDIKAIFISEQFPMSYDGRELIINIRSKYNLIDVAFDRFFQ